MKITIVHPLPFNSMQGLHVVPCGISRPEAQIQVEVLSDNAFCDLDQKEIEKLISVLQQELDRHNG